MKRAFSNSARYVVERSPVTLSVFFLDRVVSATITCIQPKGEPQN
jgi:hypothetical protein